MGIDWFILSAQIINFLVLVWLLKRFLYGRIIKAMDDREAKIAARLDDAAATRAAAEGEASAYRAKNREIESRRDELLRDAEDEAARLRQGLVEDTRTELAALRDTEREAMDLEWRRLAEDLGVRVGRSSLDVSRRLLKDLSSVELEGELIKVFLSRLAALPESERESVSQGIRTGDPNVVVRTAFRMGPEQRESLATALRESLDERAEVTFEVEPDLVLGIEADAHTHRFSWNVAEYLVELGDEFQRAVRTRADSDVEA